MTIINAQVTRVEFCGLPEDHSAAPPFTVSVEYRGYDKWAVLWRNRCLNRDGEWVHEGMPGNRDPDTIDQIRFDYDEAMNLAGRQAATIKVRGLTYQQVLEGDWE